MKVSEFTTYLDWESLAEEKMVQTGVCLMSTDAFTELGQTADSPGPCAPGERCHLWKRSLYKISHTHAHMALNHHGRNRNLRMIEQSRRDSKIDI